MTDIVSEEAGKTYRDRFLTAFDRHEELNEVEADVLAVENTPADTPDDFAAQRIIAAYDQVEVWLLNEDGPVQAFYESGEVWGEPGSVPSVVEEIEQTLFQSEQYVLAEPVATHPDDVTRNDEDSPISVTCPVVGGPYESYLEAQDDDPTDDYVIVGIPNDGQ